jgi:hypothetical protein
MRNKLRVRLWLIGLFLFYLFVFLLWFPRWQHAPHSLSARLLGVLFGAMTAVLFVLGIVGEFLNPLGLGPVTDLAVRVYEHFKDDSKNGDAAQHASRHASLSRPALVITKRLRDGTPIRGACPLCGVEFSTEAFTGDKTYPHESRLDNWYQEHFEAHLCE